MQQGVTKLMDFYTRYLCADAYIQAVFSFKPKCSPETHCQLIAAMEDKYVNMADNAFYEYVQLLMKVYIFAA